MIENKKASILLILKVLEEYSDEEHFLTQQDIIDKVGEMYGIELERKSVAFSIYLLQELGYDINKSPKGGYALLSRTFDNSEIRFITDALFSMKSLSKKQAETLSKKVNSCLSKYQRKNYNYIYKSGDFKKYENKDLFYTLELIEEAKRKGKRISFQYLSYDENGKPYAKLNGFRYIVSPYYTVNSNERYYLMCNYREKYRPIQLFRIDYIVNPKIEDEWPIKPIETLDGMADFNIYKYLKDTVYLLEGNVIVACFKIENEEAIQYVVDWFGTNARVYKYSPHGNQYVTVVGNENALFYWYMQYSESYTVLSPQSLIQRVMNEANKIVEKHKSCLMEVKKDEI